MERRQAILDRETSRVTAGLISFLDAHFTMSEEEYKQFYSLVHSEEPKPRKAARSSSTRHGEDDEDDDGDDERDTENRKSRKRRRSESDDVDEATKKPNLSMKHMLQELMNKSVSSSPYVNWMSANWFEYFVEMLINAGIAEPHPEQHGLIKLANFL